MKKVFYCLMLAISIIGESYAQDGRITNSDKIFEISADYFRLRYFVDLGKGNKFKIELRQIEDLQKLGNPDSLLRLFLHDIQPLKDALSDELTSKRIDYIIDLAGRAKVRIQQFQPKGSSFLVDHGNAAALKLEQDTINFITTTSSQSRYKLKNGERYTDTRFIRTSFFVNRLEDLNNYTDDSLNNKIKLLKKNVNNKWVKETWINGKVYKVHIEEDASISSTKAKGYLSSPGITFVFPLSVSIQNYKNYFVPSTSLGSSFNISNSFFKNEVGIFWEPNFFFTKKSDGSLQTFRNDFITVAWGHGFIKEHDPTKESKLLAIFSYSYLVHRSGNFITKHTSRFGAGKLALFEGMTKIEPAIYFNDFFKGVTPTLRIIQEF